MWPKGASDGSAWDPASLRSKVKRDFIYQKNNPALSPNNPALSPNNPALLLNNPALLGNNRYWASRGPAPHFIIFSRKKVAICLLISLKMCNFAADITKMEKK